MSLPEELREELGIKEGGYLVIEKIGGTHFIKKLEMDKDLLEKVRERVKKIGITREQLEDIIHDSRGTVKKRDTP